MGNKYNCYWVDAHGNKKNEGQFLVTQENEGVIMLSRQSVGEASQFPKQLAIVLNKEFGKVTTEGFATNYQYWGTSIQVHLGDFAFPFIFEMHKRYVIQVDDAQKQEWLEEFLDDNKIDYIC